MLNIFGAHVGGGGVSPDDTVLVRFRLARSRWCVSECTIISQQLKRANVTTSGFLLNGNKQSPKTLDSTWLNTISRVQTLTAEVHKILQEFYKLFFSLFFPPFFFLLFIGPTPSVQ